MPLIAAAIIALASLTPGEIRESVDQVFEDYDYQETLPFEEAGGEPVANRLNRRRGGIDISTPVAVVSKVLIWVAIGVGIALLLAFLVQQLQSIPPDPRTEEAMIAELAAQAPAPRVTLADADGLASQGRFGEAIHALLLHALVALRQRYALDYQPAQTSREILRRLPPSDRRASLADLVLAVELTHFGGRESGRSDYEHCKSSFERFVHSDAGTIT
jgi:hypothetical protein